MAGNAELSIILRLRDEASRQLATVTQNLKSTTETLKPLGMAAAALGGSMLAGITLAVKAAEEERESQAKLAVVLKNVGENYDTVKDSLEKVIQTTMLKTAVSDEDQRNALAQLVIITGNYQLSLDALPVALDLAAASGMSLDSAATALGKALIGNDDALKRLGITIPAGLSDEEKLAFILGKIGGSAEGAANPMEKIKLALESVLAALGTSLLGDLETLATNISNITTKATEWIANNEDLTRVLLIVGLALSILLIAFGAFVLAAPGILAAGAMVGSGFLAALGPIGLAILAIIAIIALAAVVILNWDKVKTFFTQMGETLSDVWHTIYNNTVETLNRISDALNTWVGWFDSLPKWAQVLLGITPVGALNILPHLPTIEGMGGGASRSWDDTGSGSGTGATTTGTTGVVLPPEIQAYQDAFATYNQPMTAAPVNVTINGWVGNDQDIAEKIRQIVILQGQRNAGTAFAGFA